MKALRHTAVPLRRVLIRLAFLGAAIMFNPPGAQSFSGPAAPPALDESDIRADMLQTGRGGTDDEVRGALVFRVRANDESVGSRDGDGIARVDLIVLNPDGDEVYRRRENNAGYCAFGGGEPNCSAYVFADHDNRWPDRNGRRGEEIRDGEEYTLRAEVTAKDGSRRSFNWSVELQLADSSDLRVKLESTGRGNRDTTVRNELAFRISANDPTEGNRDGAGIDGVDMIIIDSDGIEVYRKRENNAGYCAFGGGEPNCSTYVFADHGNRWPDRDGDRGDPIRRGDTYILRAEVDAEDGRSTMVDTYIVIR